MRSRGLAALAALMMAVATGPARSEDCSVPDFWSVPRHGANSFNKVETPEHIRAARDFGIGFLRIAFGKWKGTGREFLAGDLDHRPSRDDRRGAKRQLQPRC